MRIEPMFCGRGGGDSVGQSMLGRVQSFSDIISAFFEESEITIEGSSDADGDEEESGNACDPEKKSFWESRFHLLEVSLAKTSSVEAKIRREAQNLLAALRSSGMTARSCCKADVKDCKRCKMMAVTEGLRSAGYDCAVCKSKWKSFQDILPGEHRYLEINHSVATKKNPIRIIIEVDFRSEFDIARSGNEYEALVSRLPELFVGKPEKLRSVIKVMCSAAKRCMKDKGMHMGPWRKHDYMISKWFSPSIERMDATPNIATEVRQHRPKMKSSLLTFDMVEIMPTISRLHCAV